MYHLFVLKSHKTITSIQFGTFGTTMSQVSTNQTDSFPTFFKMTDVQVVQPGLKIRTEIIKVDDNLAKILESQYTRDDAKSFLENLEIIETSFEENNKIYVNDSGKAKCKTSKHPGEFQLDLVVLSTFPKDPVSFSEGDDSDPTKPPTFMNLKFSDVIKFAEKKTEQIREIENSVVDPMATGNSIQRKDTSTTDPSSVEKLIPKNSDSTPSLEENDPLIKVEVSRREKVRISLEGFVDKNNLKEFVFHVVEIGGTENDQPFVGGVINMIAAYLEKENRGHLVDEIYVNDGGVGTKICNKKISFVKTTFDSIRHYTEDQLANEIKNKSITLFVVNARQFKAAVESNTQLIKDLSEVTTNLLTLASKGQNQKGGYSSSFVITTCDPNTDKNYKVDLKSDTSLFSRMIRVRERDEGDISVILDSVVSLCSKF